MNVEVEKKDDDGPPYPMPKDKIRSKHSMFQFEKQ